MMNWPKGLREMVDMPVPCGVWPVLAWSLTPGEKVSAAIRDAAQEYALKCGDNAVFAFIREIPSGAEEFVDVAGATLVLADWVPSGFVVLVRGGMLKMNAQYQSWRTVEVRHE
jgi:hypothetical protein